MGAKAIYTDTRAKIIHELVISKDMETIHSVIKDKHDYEKFYNEWQAVNLDEFVDKFHITSDTYNMEHNQRKISFFSNGKEYAIVCAVGGKYFRVHEVTHDGSNPTYLGIDLKQPRISSNLRKKEARYEYQRLTHFRMTYKKGTV